MRILRFNHLKNESRPLPRTGLLLAGDTIADLRVGYAKYLMEKMKDSQGREIAALRIASNVVSMLAIGKPAREAMESSAAYLSDLLESDPSAKGPAGEPLFLPFTECKLHAPIRPTKIIGIGKQAGSKNDSEAPPLWIKANNTINSPFRDIVMPDATKQLQCETKLAVVIGERCQDVAEEKAYDAVLGYMIANDVSVRDGANPNNMFNTFLPTGPWVVTSDEIRNAMNLRIRAWVNGKPGRDGNTRDMPLSIPQLVAHVSRMMKLEPGDMILTGTPKDHAVALPLQLGDTLDTEIEGIGKLRNKVGDDPSL